MLSEELKAKGYRTESAVLMADVKETKDAMPPESRMRFADAVIDYMLTGKYDDQSDPLVKIAMMAHKRKIDASIERHLKAIAKKDFKAWGEKGGAPTKEMKQVLESWNQMAEQEDLPKQNKLNGKLIVALRNLFDNGETVESMTECFYTKVADSDYLTGKVDRNVRAHFEWVLTHYEDIQAGKYDNSGKRYRVGHYGEDTEDYDREKPF